MSRALWLADVLRAAGLTVVEHDGWKTRGRDGLDPQWQMFHHTASAATSGDAPALNVVINGRADLPGPLCQVLIARSGVMHIIASGVANHAGAGTYPDGSTGNRLAIGWEAENNGVDEPWPQDQLEDLATAMAAVCRHLNLPASKVIGHKEYTSRKIDPRHIDMFTWRTRIAAKLATPKETAPMAGSSILRCPELGNAQVFSFHDRVYRAPKAASIDENKSTCEILAVDEETWNDVTADLKKRGQLVGD